jgi:hypothetical protein
MRGARLWKKGFERKGNVPDLLVIAFVFLTSSFADTSSAFPMARFYLVVRIFQDTHAFTGSSGLIPLTPSMVGQPTEFPHTVFIIWHSRIYRHLHSTVLSPHGIVLAWHALARGA